MSQKEILYRVVLVNLLEISESISSAAKRECMTQSPYKTSAKAWTPKVARTSYDSRNRKETEAMPSTKAS